MDPTDRPLYERSATQLALAIKTGEVSSVEVVDACLRRIDAVNPRINAVVRIADGAHDAVSGGVLGSDALVVLVELQQLAPALDRHPELGEPVAEDALGLVLR